MAQGIRRSTQLNLSFPYDWSNPAISDEALIINILNRGIFVDICRVCAYFGLDVVEGLASGLRNTTTGNISLTRKLNNIRKGFIRAQAR